MSNPSGRSWYRLSSIVRPTPHSSRDPSPPRHVIDPPPYPPPQRLSPPLRHPSPKEVQEAKPSPVTSSRSIKHEYETTHQKNKLTSSENTNLVHGPNKEQQQHESDDIIMGTQGVVSISGENKGAVMEILRSQNRTRGAGKEHRLQSSDDEKSKSNSKKHINNSGNLPMDSFVNSNVQMINRSVVYNSTETHHDPGVHFSLCRKPSSGNGFITKDHGNGYTNSIN